MSSELDKIIDIRTIKETDLAFIYSTFLDGLYYGDSWFSSIPKAIFMENYKKFIEAILNSPKNVIFIACLKDEPDTITGYSIVSLDGYIIHWVYVKKKWRKLGIAKRLVPQRPSYVTHLNALGKALLNKLDGALFNPFAL